MAHKLVAKDEPPHRHLHLSIAVGRMSAADSGHRRFASERSQAEQNVEARGPSKSPVRGDLHGLRFRRGVDWLNRLAAQTQASVHRIYVRSARHKLRRVLTLIPREPVVRGTRQRCVSLANQLSTTVVDGFVDSSVRVLIKKRFPSRATA